MRTLLFIGLLVGSATACAAQTPDTLEAKLQRGLSAYDAGRRDEAYRIFDSFIDDYNNATTRLTSQQLTAVGIALRHLGERDPQLFKDALAALDQAVAADPNNHRARVVLGELFLDKYNSEQARQSFDDVLRAQPNHADALVGLARVLSFDHRPGAIEAARKALAAKADHAAAHAFLTQAFIDSDALDSARVHADALMKAQPSSVESLIAAASVAQATGHTKAVADLREHISDNTTALARFDVALAEQSVSQRQYAEAVRLARNAITSDTLSWRAWSVLGINQLRLGDATAARTSLEKSFKGDPYNVWVKNTLDMLDRMDTFVTQSAGSFTIVASPRDAAVLSPYAFALGEEAVAKLSARYGYKPPLPIRLEFFDRHADFSVRTVGLAGLGALGVSFGSVLALDAPGARERGDFNWGSTLWHEIAHAFHLGMTKHRVPRWFTEGLATLEERRARPGWGEEGLAMFLAAAAGDKLLPLADLNSGFVRPSYPEQISVSYYQASLILEMIEQQHGEAAIRDLLRAYADGKSTEAALRDVLKKTPAQIDEAFAVVVERRMIDQARQQAARNAADYDRLVAQGSARSLESAIYIWPYDIALHAKLADVYTGFNPRDVVRERQVIVALQPVDMAEARYQLALAYHNAGDNAKARKEVLRALEAAPSFARAQDLLLKLSEAQ